MAEEKITRRDVARLAGVSEGTVSNVLAGRAVRSELKVRVREAMAELGYRPNLVARSLRSNRTHMVGLIVPDLLENPFYAGIIAGVEDAAAPSGFNVVICVAKGGLKRSVSALLERRVDAVILGTAPDDKSEVAPLLDAKMPVVCCACFLPDEMRVPWVVADYQRGTELGVDHLLELGHSRIGLLPGRRAGSSGRRLEGWVDALALRGLQPRKICSGDYTYESGYRAAAELLRAGVTAVLAGNDLMAIGAMDAIRDLGLRVPEDVSIVGFDDTWLAQHSYPRLTSVRVPDHLIGERACEAAIALAAPSSPIDISNATVPVELMVRCSTAPPRPETVPDPEAS